MVACASSTKASAAISANRASCRQSDDRAQWRIPHFASQCAQAEVIDALSADFANGFVQQRLAQVAVVVVLFVLFICLLHVITAHILVDRF